MKLQNPRKISELNCEELKELQSLLSRVGLIGASGIDGVFGINTKNAWEKFKQSEHLGDLDLIGESSYFRLMERAKENNILIARPQFDLVFRYAKKTDREKYFLPINRACVEFEINNLRRLAAFLAQVSHESGNLQYSQEIASGAAYEGRRDLGNIYPGDGVKFKGSGLIQLTGRHNHRWAGKELGLPLEENPALGRNDPFVSARIAGLYWKSRNLNTLADLNTLDSFRLITRKINGGFNGLGDRVRRWNHAKGVLQC